jgi:hypothetical protein
MKYAKPRSEPSMIYGSPIADLIDLFTPPEPATTSKPPVMTQNNPNPL